MPHAAAVDVIRGACRDSGPRRECTRCRRTTCRRGDVGRDGRREPRPCTRTAPARAPVGVSGTCRSHDARPRRTNRMHPRSRCHRAGGDTVCAAAVRAARTELCAEVHPLALRLEAPRAFAPHREDMTPARAHAACDAHVLCAAQAPRFAACLVAAVATHRDRLRSRRRLNITASTRSRPGTSRATPASHAL
jgi:hypothetical protein